MHDDDVRVVDMSTKSAPTASPPEEPSADEVHIDAQLNGTHIVLKAHAETPSRSELSLDLAHPKPEEVKAPIAVAPIETMSVPVRRDWKDVLKQACVYCYTSLRRIRPSRLERIVMLAEEEGSITVEEVASHFHVSQAMATRDLAQLVGSGKLKRVGVHQARYEPAVERDDF